MLKGLLYGLGFVLTYFLSNYEPINNVLFGLGGFAHVVKAWGIFTIGFACSQLISRMKK